jgi:hypothetical protein
MARVDDAEREELKRKIGGVENYNGQALRELVTAAPENVEVRKAMVSSIMSAEFAGIDAFSRKVVEWQEWDVPESLLLAMARQTWDEVRHAQLSKGVLEAYGGVVGEYPDTLAGGQGGAQAQGGQQANGAAARQANGEQAGTRAQAQATSQAALGEAFMRNPIASLSMTNVSLEGGALTLFKGTSELGHKIGDDLMELCYDYNWADEVTHVSIGDYFVKKLTEGDPQKERFALMAHARHEMMRGNLTAEQAEELKTFFAEEMERAEEALVTDQPAAGGYR